ncbi:hypothetical protein THRCLA_21036 [Thraustotheca clavata]|uniref:RanBP2-type domain-containing protein n=1 Tax=Thraustotheca clavata TaxID=74557 RepID=A0A1W0A112_9STRA|nr:hypothetical protein THRCLA_21036 [Thraustotheca clavata]
MEKDCEVETWQCPICTLINNYSFDVCEACGTTSPHVLAAMAGQESAEAKDEEDGERDRAPSTSTRPSRGSSIEEDYEAAAQLDPWAQAEDEWAVVEATQETKVKRK